MNVQCPECKKTRPVLNPGANCLYCGYGELEISVDDVGAEEFVCPECGGELQLTAYRFLQVDRDSGDADITDMPELYALYCENDCFVVEDLTEEPKGIELIDLAMKALDASEAAQEEEHTKEPDGTA
mgnify:CR=1 FL=1